MIQYEDQKDNKEKTLKAKLHNFLIMKNPELGLIDDDFELALKIKEIVFWKMTLLYDLSIHWERIFPFEIFTNLYENTNHGVICAGFSYLFAAACIAFEIENRLVELYSDISNTNYSSHAVNEIFYNGKWIGIDITFNCYPTTNNNPINYEDIWNLIKTINILKLNGFLGKIRLIKEELKIIIQV